MKMDSKITKRGKEIRAYMGVDHDDAVKKVLSAFKSDGTLRNREGTTVEFKKTYQKGEVPIYAKTLAGYSNNRGGYIIFGVTDAPRRVVGLNKDSFERIKQEELTESLNSLFSPSIEWDIGTTTVMVPVFDDEGNKSIEERRVGWIFAEESENKPLIATKEVSGAKISSGDVFYRYRARTQKIRYAEMLRILEERANKERESLLRIIEAVRRNGTASLGIINYSNGKISTPYGVDVTLDRKIVLQVLRKAKYIKEGSFSETDGMPVIKVSGNIDLAEEVPVPDGDPNETHPFIQKELAQKLGITTQELYALIWYFKMKESPKYHIEVRTSKSGTVHKFSNFAFQFLSAKIKELSGKPEEFDRINSGYKNRNKIIDRDSSDGKDEA